MSRKWKIALSVIVVVVAFAALGLLRWGQVVYWLSDGERGWSLGMSAYQALGWGADAYRADFDRAGFGRADFGPDDEDRTSDCTVAEDSTDHHRFFGHGGRRVEDRHRDKGGHVFFAGGMGCLMVWVLLAGAGVVLFRHYRKTHPPAPTPEE